MRSIAFALALALLVAAAAPVARGQAIMPHAIVGFVKDGAGSAVAGASVTLENGRTGETLSVTANSLGQYSADLSSMPEGFRTGDLILVTAAYGDLEGSATVAVSSRGFDMCNVTVMHEQPDSMWQFRLPLIAVIVLVAAVAAFLILRRPPRHADEGRRRRQK